MRRRDSNSSVGSAGGNEDKWPKPLGPEDIKRREEAKDILTRYPNIQQISSIYFKDSETVNRQLKPIVRCAYNTGARELIREVLIKQWKLTDPRIVLLIISNVGSINEWTNEKQIKSFQNGIMTAAESTNMWLICNGLDVGVTTLIGEAVTNYKTEVKFRRHIKDTKKTSKLHFIGVAEDELVTHLPLITQSNEDRIEIQTGRTAYEPNKYPLNQNLSHYVLIKDSSIDKNGVNIFINNLIHFLSMNNQSLTKEVYDSKEVLLPIETNEVPVVSVVIKGGYGSSRLVLTQIENRIPVVVLQGSGGLADLLAFVSIEIRDHCLNLWDPDFVESNINPELTNRIIDTFSKYRTNKILLNRFRHRILESVRLSRREGQQYLTIINMSDGYSCNLEKLTEYMLSALFKAQHVSNEVKNPNPFNLNESQKTEPNFIKRDLHLCVDWNCPEVAKKEVLSKDPQFALNEEKKLFEDSLIRNNRHRFVDLFLSMKFKLRDFVSPKRLRKLFRRMHSNDFFRTVCWETILDRTAPKEKQSPTFIYNELNWLVEVCTGFPNFYNEEELELFVMKQYPYSEKEAERKALEMIVFWAILNFKKKVVRVLWRHSDTPIHLALIIATSFERLSWYVSDESVCEELKAESKAFVTFAVTVLDKCYKDSVVRTQNVLSETSHDWNYKTAVDWAAFGRYRQFFSHISVQRWLSDRFMGNIMIQENRSKWIPLPVFFKVLLSAYFVFPINVWIRLTNILIPEEDEEEEDDEDIEVSKSEVNNKNKSIKENSNVESSEKKPALRKRLLRAPNLKAIKDRLDKRYSQLIPSIWTKAYEVWNAPITKFWNYQFFYIFYLSIFSIAVLFPSCGNYPLDSVVIFWTVLIIVDDCRQTYIFSQNHSYVSLKYRLFEIISKTLFVMIYTYSRIIVNPETNPIFDPYEVKVIMCLGLLQAFNVLLSTFLPISQTLGPLIYRLKIMVLVDFLNFIRLSILVMISFGVVIQAIIYPDLSVDNQLLRQGFHRAFFNLFISYIDELLEDKECNSKLWGNTNITRCTASPYFDETCRVTGYAPYVFVIIYMILLKLILLTLLFALFASSSATLTADTDAIWKFQRFALVQDFVARAPLPPPLNLIYYLYLFFKWICELSRNTKKGKTFSELFNIFKDYTTPKTHNRLLSDIDYTYFRGIASETYDETENQMTPESVAAQTRDCMQYLFDESKSLNLSVRYLRGTISGMDRTNRKLYALCENMGMHGKVGSDIINRKGPHILSRLSPYPNTRVQRYPVPDMYVSWDVMFVDYDPIAYSKPKADFLPALKDYVDDDLLFYIEDGFEKDLKDVPVLEWNRISTNAAGISVDRQSWEKIDGQNIIYKLEYGDPGLPVNPNGRTGLRGRGALPRWGPNHYVMLVITREIGDTLEVLTQKMDQKSKTMSLLSNFIPAEVNYKTFEALFKITEPALKNWTTDEKMINFFKSDPDNIVKIDPKKRTYLDDPLNTDQAWIEVELWHIHYINGRALYNMIAETVEWYSVTESFFSALNFSHSEVLQSIVEKLKSQKVTDG